VQGERDAFGGPGEVAGALAGGAGEVRAVPGDHALTRDVAAVVTAALSWLVEVPGRGSRAPGTPFSGCGGAAPGR